MRRWTAWIPFAQPGTTKLRAVIAVNHADGRIEVLAIDDAGQVWRTAQTTPTDTNWSPLAKLSGLGMTTGPGIAPRPGANGRSQLVGVDNLGNIWQSAQTSAKAGTRSPWSQLDGQLRP
jgi:hypothetical protein